MNQYGNLAVQQPVNPIQLNPYLTQRTNSYYQPQQNNGINWVQGIEGAKAFQMLPNSNAILLDSENDGKLYIKVCDNVGMCSLRKFQYAEITDEPIQSNVDLSEYVKKSELENLINSILGGTNNEQSVSTTNGKSKFGITK